MNSLIDTLGYFGSIFLELVCLFLAISTVIALLLQYLPKERFAHYLSGTGGYLTAAGLGAITPFCACSTVPMTLGLLQAGVPIGPVMTFVLVSPLLNPIIVAMIWTLMGAQASLVFFAVCFLAAIAGGATMRALHADRFVRAMAVTPAACCEGSAGVHRTFGAKFRAAFASAYGDLTHVLIYLLIGTAIGRIYGYVPQEWVVSLAGRGNPAAIPVAALIGIPLYIRAETAIPIGLALVQKGMSQGAVIALIIGGAGMAIPEMSMLLSIFKGRIVAAIVTMVFLTAVVGGYCFDWFLP